MAEINQTPNAGHNTPATKPQQLKTGLVKVTEQFTNMLVTQAKDLSIEYSTYQTMCIANAIAKMQEVLVSNGANFNDVDQTSVTLILQQVAMLQINLAAVPREGYVILRNEKVPGLDNTTKWIKKFEFGLEGDGNDAILRHYGVDVKKVYTPWLVRENDGFEYPGFNGLELTPPKWQPKDYHSKVVRVVYPIEKKDGSVEYHIAEREGVVKNLQAHISNNLMKAKDDKISKEKKDALLKRIANLTLDSLINDEECQAWISPAWKSPHSREDMIIRKLRNNAIKKFPKDFKNAYVKNEYEKTFDDYEQYQSNDDIDPNAINAEINEKAGKEKVDIPFLDEPKEIKKEESSEPVNQFAPGGRPPRSF